MLTMSQRTGKITKNGQFSQNARLNGHARFKTGDFSTLVKYKRNSGIRRGLSGVRLVKLKSEMYIREEDLYKSPITHQNYLCRIQTRIFLHPWACWLVWWLAVAVACGDQTAIDSKLGCLLQRAQAAPSCQPIIEQNWDKRFHRPITGQEDGNSEPLNSFHHAL